MLQIIIAIVIAVMLWSVRRAWFSQRDVWVTKIERNVKEQEVDDQNEYVDLLERINKQKDANGGKWFTIEDLHNATKSSA